MHCLDAGKRLCSAQELEDACRGGSRKQFPYGNTYEPQKCPTEGDKPQPSGRYDACGEGFGLRDMIGNVWEWVNDWYGSNYYSTSPSVNPQGPSSGTYRVLRGGSWYDVSDFFRASNRNNSYLGNSFSNVGFRVARTP